MYLGCGACLLLRKYIPGTGLMCTWRIYLYSLIPTGGKYLEYYTFDVRVVCFLLCRICFLFVFSFSFFFSFSFIHFYRVAKHFVTAVCATIIVLLLAAFRFVRVPDWDPLLVESQD